VTVVARFEPVREDFKWPQETHLEPVKSCVVPPPAWTGVLTVVVNSATEVKLPEDVSGGKKNPYHSSKAVAVNSSVSILVSSPGKPLPAQHTKAVTGHSPSWCEVLTWEVEQEDGPLDLECVVQDKKAGVLGRCRVPFPQGLGKMNHDLWLQGDGGKMATGSVSVQVEWKPVHEDFVFPAPWVPPSLPPVSGDLVVTVVGGEWLSASQSCAVVEVQDSSNMHWRCTSVVKKTSDPAWGQKLRFRWRGEEVPRITLELSDSERSQAPPSSPSKGFNKMFRTTTKAASLGSTSVPFPSQAGPAEHELYLSGDPSVTGLVRLRTEWVADPRAPEFVWPAREAAEGDDPVWHGQLVVTAESASDLRAADMSLFGKGTSDPYVKLLTTTIPRPSTTWKSKVIKKTLNPVWNETGSVQLITTTKPEFLVEIWDEDLDADDFLGEAVLPLPTSPGEKQVDLVLNTNKSKNKRDAKGAVKLRVEWRPAHPERFHWDWNE